MPRYDDAWLPPEGSEPEQGFEVARRVRRTQPAEAVEPRMTLRQFALLARTGSGFQVYCRSHGEDLRRPRAEWEILFQRYLGREIKG